MKPEMAITGGMEMSLQDVGTELGSVVAELNRSSM